MKRTAPYQPGQTFEAPYPFVRCTYETADHGGGEGPPVVTVHQGWKPGVRYEQVPPEGDTRTHVDGLGKVVLTVAGVYRPPGFPTRVFYLRTWVNPEGVAFGKRKLRVTTQTAFTGYTRGYRHWRDVDYIADRACTPWGDFDPEEAFALAGKDTTP